MIKELTQQQIDLMEKVKQKWLDKLFKLPKLNKKKAKDFISYLYGMANYKNPKIIFLDSPLALQVACNMFSESQVRSQVRSQVESQVGSQVWSQVESQVGSQVWSQVWSQGKTFYSFAYYGSIWDLGWVAFYDFFEQIGIKNESFNKFKTLIDCGIYDMIQQNETCFVCGMPEHISRDAQNRLHSTEKPATGWRDGFELYYLHGVLLEKDLWEKITKKEISAIDVLKIENMEQRYIALQELGAEKLLKELSAKMIDKTEKGNELYQLDGIIPNKSLKLLKYSCPSTSRVYTKFVPFEFNKADEAQSWSFNLKIEEYYSLKSES
jgi:hypothetical protein